MKVERRIVFTLLIANWHLNFVLISDYSSDVCLLRNWWRQVERMYIGVKLLKDAYNQFECEIRSHSVLELTIKRIRLILCHCLHLFALQKMWTKVRIFALFLRTRSWNKNNCQHSNFVCEWKPYPAPHPFTYSTLRASYHILEKCHIIYHFTVIKRWYRFSENL